MKVLEADKSINIVGIEAICNDRNKVWVADKTNLHKSGVNP